MGTIGRVTTKRIPVLKPKGDPAIPRPPGSPTKNADRSGHSAPAGANDEDTQVVDDADLERAEKDNARDG